MSSGAASSASSEREDRVFTAAFGIMDSAQDGEAVAAFLRVRAILHRHDSGFRRLLERCREADRLNAELGRQNTELLHENAALRARDSRPPVAASGPPAASGFRHWDIGLIIIIALWTAFGLLGAATAFALAAAVLIGAAFTHGFSPFRFLAGALLALAAYAVAAPAPAKSRQTAVSAHPAVSATQQRSAPISAVTTTAAATEASPRRQPGAPFAADPPGRPPAAPQMRYAAQADCGAYGLQPGLDCAGRHRWRRNSFPDFEPSRAVRSD